jgi:thimet oligopeptidase
LVTAIEPTSFPASGWAQFLASRADAALAAAQALVDQLKDGTPRTAAEIVALWNDCDIEVGAASGLAGVLAQMHPDAQVRSIAEEREQAVARFLTGRGLDRDLYEVVAAADLAEPGLDDAARRLLEKVLGDFRRDGVDRDEQVRERLRALSEELTLVGQEFSRVIREDVRTVRLRPEQLAGLPQDFIDAHPVDDDRLVTLSTDYPDVIPFRTFAHDAAARTELMTAFYNRGWPDNDVTLRRMLDLRAEKAALLGYATWADYDAEVKMIGSGDAIGDFIERLSALAADSSARDFAVLLQRKRADDPAATTLDASDSMYYAELIRKENYAVDAQQVRRYFDFPRVREGLLGVTGRLFGVAYEPVPDAVTWHEDVAVYDVRRAGERLGRIYLDLHPREGKFKHAAQFDLVRGVAGRQLPEGVLACNFPRGLMGHTEVVTLFHEFGHLVHHILGGHVDILRFSGVATEWDFVEAPSQMLEEWAWDADVLQTFAVDAAGEPIPADLVDRMRAAKDFGKGCYVRTQMFYAALAYQLHVATPADITALAVELQHRYDQFSPLPHTHWHTSFGHLEGYTSAYYTYMWSLVIAKDMFSAFDAGNLFDPAVAGRYRDEILARGGSRDAADLVAAFLGRPYSFDSFAQWLERAPVAVSG